MSNEHNNAHAQEQCNACCGTGRMVRDPDIGTDQECFVCDGAGFLPAQDVGLTDEFIKKAAGTPEGYKFAAKGISKIDVWPHGGNWFPLYSLAQVQSIIAALRAKESK